MATPVVLVPLYQAAFRELGYRADLQGYGWRRADERLTRWQRWTRQEAPLVLREYLIRVSWEKAEPTPVGSGYTAAHARRDSDEASRTWGAGVARETAAVVDSVEAEIKKTQGMDRGRPSVLALDPCL
jgi:hypothetical protein